MATKKTAAKPAAPPAFDYYYETTPYGVEQKGKKFAVVQSWWGKTISTHKTRELADEACIEEARAQGCLRRIRFKVKPRP